MLLPKLTVYIASSKAQNGVRQHHRCWSAATMPKAAMSWSCQPGAHTSSTAGKNTNQTATAPNCTAVDCNQSSCCSQQHAGIPGVWWCPAGAVCVAAAPATPPAAPDQKARAPAWMAQTSPAPRTRWPNPAHIHRAVFSVWLLSFAAWASKALPSRHKHYQGATPPFLLAASDPQGPFYPFPSASCCTYPGPLPRSIMYL